MKTSSVLDHGKRDARIVCADVGTRIERDLDVALSRLRRLGGAVVVVELPGTIGENSAFADEVDQIQATASRDVGLATRELLLERVNRLSAALGRLNEGEYGVCVECAEPIAPARLDAVPEVQTCVRCQAGLERLGRQADRSRRSAFAAGENGIASEAIPPSYRSSLFPNEEDRDATR
jgi:RNA polymerase-binding transcription factor DksA